MRVLIEGYLEKSLTPPEHTHHAPPNSSRNLGSDVGPLGPASWPFITRPLQPPKQALLENNVYTIVIIQSFFFHAPGEPL